MKPSLEAVVFDLDGVIFDSERTMYGIWCELAGPHGLVGMEEAYPRLIGTNRAMNRKVMEDAFGDAINFDEYFAEARGVFDSRYGGGKIPVKKGAVLLLEALKQAGVKTALASSTATAIVTRELEENKLAQYFDAIIGGDAVTRSKPAPDIFLAACERIGAEPAKSVCIEDSYSGIEAAHAALMRPIMVPDVLPATEEMETLAEAILPDLEAVWDYLREEAEA